MSKQCRFRWSQPAPTVWRSFHTPYCKLMCQRSQIVYIRNKELTMCFNVGNRTNCLSKWRYCIDVKLVFSQNCIHMTLKALVTIYLCFCRLTCTSWSISKLRFQTGVVNKVVPPSSVIVSCSACWCHRWVNCSGEFAGCQAKPTDYIVCSYGQAWRRHGVSMY